ncbi:hypothetical protein E2C01_066710 [Portunus trituberculatus]|uniref:Uncharacterized protein n=1 Tax=Portunus trituberculatus TaxID=210409 RepID=A0A5B7HRP9_PORTR|nr:hypothetical protein [Portunus trituberculatus]
MPRGGPHVTCSNIPRRDGKNYYRGRPGSFVPSVPVLASPPMAAVSWRNEARVRTNLLTRTSSQQLCITSTYRRHS